MKRRLYTPRDCPIQLEDIASKLWTIRTRPNRLDALRRVRVSAMASSFHPGLHSASSGLCRQIFKPGRAAGRAPSSTATARSAPRSWRSSNTAGPPNRWRLSRLAREQHRPVISHETIYRFIYAQMARKTEYAWRHYLPRAKAKRGRRCYGGAQPGVLYRSAPPAGGAAGGGRGSPYPGPLGGRSDGVPDLRPSHLDPP